MKTIVCFLLIVCMIPLVGGCTKNTVIPPGKHTSLPLRTDLSDEGQIGKVLNDHFERWQGVPYRDGGADRNGIDCSGFVFQTYSSQFGLKLPRSTDGLAESGNEVAKSELKSGDLVLFKTGWLERHVGIYLSGNKFIHSSSKRGVMKSSLNDYYWKDRFWQARRILN